MMRPRFDFITGDTFREVLESDYQELHDCFTAKAWKAVHVMAGSIIEALLSDWLIGNGISKHAGRPVEEMGLGDMLKACQHHKLISERAEKLTAAIQTFRNLIHPGRVTRLDTEVNESGAVIAKALVEVIADEICKAKKAKYGYTSEQIVAKVISDPACVAYLPRLLRETKEQEKEKLLVSGIFDQYQELYDSRYWSQVDVTARGRALIDAFRITMETSSDETKVKAVARYVGLLKTGNGYECRQYERAFFDVKFLHHCTPDDRGIILDHLLGMLEDPECPCEMLQGVGAWIDESNCERFSALLLPKPFSHHFEHRHVRHRLLNEELHSTVPSRLRAKIVSHLMEMKSLFETLRDTEEASAYQYIIDNTYDEHIPF